MGKPASIGRDVLVDQAERYLACAFGNRVSRADEAWYNDRVREIVDHLLVVRTRDDVPAAVRNVRSLYSEIKQRVLGAEAEPHQASGQQFADNIARLFGLTNLSGDAMASLMTGTS